MKRVLVVLVLFAVLTALFAVPATAEPGGRSYLIIANTSKLPAKLAEKVSAAGGTITATIPEIGIAVATSSNPNFAADASGINGVRSVVPNVALQWTDPSYRVELDPTANPLSIGDDEPFFGLQWGLDAIDAPEAWNVGASGEGVRVAMLDEGFDMDHLDLASNINYDLSTSFVPGETVDYLLLDVFSHGSHTAGIVAAADNAFGTIGVAPEAELVLVKVLSEMLGYGEFSWIIEGIVYAADNDADIINMSLGAYLPHSGYCDQYGCVSAKEIAGLWTALTRATNYAYQQGTTIIASAGNDAIDGDHDADWMHLPSDCPHVISVSATGPLGIYFDPNTDLDIPAFYTNYGQSVIDLAAPGGNVDFDLYPWGPWYFDLVLSTGNGGWYWSAGTSMAAPHVSGVAAIIIGLNGGDMHPGQVEAALHQSADDLGKPGKDDFYGHGRVNAYNAVP